MKPLVSWMNVFCPFGDRCAANAGVRIAPGVRDTGGNQGLIVWPNQIADLDVFRGGPGHGGLCNWRARQK